MVTVSEPRCSIGSNAVTHPKSSYCRASHCRDSNERLQSADEWCRLHHISGPETPDSIHIRRRRDRQPEQAPALVHIRGRVRRIPMASRSRLPAESRVRWYELQHLPLLRRIRVDIRMFTL